MLQDKLHATMDKLSNGEFDGIAVKDSFIKEAVQEFEEGLIKQLTPRDKGFRLRMSNVGKPICQLQWAAKGAKEKRKDYNFIMRMMFGDATEVLTNLMLKLAGANITGSKNKVELKLGKTVVRGEDDIHIDDKVYDVKSCSPFAYDNKWSKGYEGLKSDDAFGYIGQLAGYSEAQGKEPGGWIVVEKSSGRLSVVEADASANEKALTLFGLEAKADKLASGADIDRQFEPIIDTFRGKPTGLKRLPKACDWCDFTASCYPDAKHAAHPSSKAKSPPKYWFVKE